MNRESEEIRRGMSVIRQSSERTRAVADSIKTISLDLDMAVRRFRTGKEGFTSSPGETPEIDETSPAIPAINVPSISTGKTELTLTPANSSSAGVEPDDDGVLYGDDEIPDGKEVSVGLEVPGRDVTSQNHNTAGGFPGSGIVTKPENVPQLEAERRKVPVLEDENGVTLSEGNWPGKEELIVVDEQGRPAKS
jgi:hypothetical protein